MTLIYIISFVIIIAVILLSVLTVNKGYQYKHTIDTAPNHNERTREVYNEDNKKLLNEIDK